MTVPAPPIPIINQFNEVNDPGAAASHTQGAPFRPNTAGVDNEATVINTPGRRRSVRNPSQHQEEEEDEFLR